MCFTYQTQSNRNWRRSFFFKDHADYFDVNLISNLSRICTRMKYQHELFDHSKKNIQNKNIVNEGGTDIVTRWENLMNSLFV